jgi:16S rRNA (adenine1518-N6/adenine1519-N6)-dimethyltransferase
MLKDRTLRLLKKHNLELDPSQDEQQLIDEKTIDLFISHTGVDKDSTVLEIGPGVGNITAEIVNKAKMVYCIEKNPKFIPALRGHLKYNFNVEVIEGDALQMEYPDHDILISNLPYAICEAFFQRSFHEKFRQATLIVPTSFAERLTASEGQQNYTKLSKIASIFYQAERHEDIPSEAYLPQPRTATCIISLKPKEPEDQASNTMKKILLQSDKLTKNALREAIISAGVKQTKRVADAQIGAMKLDEAILTRPVPRLSLEELQEIEDTLRKTQ